MQIKPHRSENTVGYCVACSNNIYWGVVWIMIEMVSLNEESRRKRILDRFLGGG